MILTNYWWLFVVAGLVSWLLTGLLRHYALTRNLLDIPNERSSHSIATPRGGGVAIVLAFLTALPLFLWLGWLTAGKAIAFGGAGTLVALVGFLDDHGHVSACWRLLVHFSAAAWALYWFGGFPLVDIFGFQLNLSWFGHVLAAVYIVWLLNLYNFMDGIDGIAGIEAITVCIGGIGLYYLSETAESVQLLPLLLVAAMAGFLFWNFPKAKIFMGDAGSGFIGFTLGLLSIQAAWLVPQLFWGWLILLGAFMVDATVTLIRRAINGERIYQAHRSHAYQHASRIYGSHAKVSLFFGLVNMCWLLPIAGCVVLGLVDGLLALVIAYAPLVWLVIHFHAGLSNPDVISTE